MAPYLLDNQTAGCNLPHNWLMSLAMDLAAFVIRTYVEVKWHQQGPFGCFQCWQLLPATSWLPTCLPSYRSSNGIGYASKSYLKWQVIQLGVYSIVGE